MRPITRIYIVADDAAMCRLLRVTLKRNGFAAIEFGFVEQEMACIVMDRPDLIILHIDSRAEIGMPTLARMRAEVGIPVIVISSNNTTSAKVTALDQGADDYIVAPFDTRELLARIRASLRRQIARYADSAILEIGEIHIDLVQRRVNRKGVRLNLTSMEYRCLAELAFRSMRAVTHTQLIEAVWGPDRLGDIGYLRALVSRLRKKIGKNEVAQISTLPGVGYRLSGKPQT